MFEKRKKPTQKLSSQRIQTSKSSSRRNISKKQIYQGIYTNIQTVMDHHNHQYKSSKNSSSLKTSKVTQNNKLEKAKSQNLSKNKKNSLTKYDFNPYKNPKSQRQSLNRKNLFGIGITSLSTGNSKIFKKSLDKNNQALLLDSLKNNQNLQPKKQKKKKYSDTNIREKKSYEYQIKGIQNPIQQQKYPCTYQGYLTENIKESRPADVKWIKKNKNKQSIFFGNSHSKQAKNKKRSKSKDKFHNLLKSPFSGQNSKSLLKPNGSISDNSRPHNNNKSIDRTQLNRQRNDQKLLWDQKRVPYDWKTVLNLYRHYLTKYETSQIKQYSKIYYIGDKAKKKQKIEYYNNNTDYMPISRIQQINQIQKIQYRQKDLKQQSPFDTEDNEYIYNPNDHIAYRYEILSQLGKGSYGQVFKVYDHKKKQQMALKMIKNKHKFTKQAFIEIKILTYIKQQDNQGVSHIVKIKDFVIFRKHVCIVFQMLSQNLYQLIIRNNYSGLNIQLIRRFAIQILTSLCFLQKHKIIHCDLKPQNILLKEYSKSGIKIIDFGSSCFQNQILYTYIQSRYYRAPEITLGVNYNMKIDIWSVGCIFAQLYTGVPLFPGEQQRDQMKYMVDTLGVPPLQFLSNGNRVSIFFDQTKNSQHPYKLKDQIKKMNTIDHFSKSLQQRISDQSFRKFILKFLQWNPKNRISAQQAIKDEWIMQGLPEQLKNVNINQVQMIKNNSSVSNNGNYNNSKKLRKSSQQRLKSQSCDTKNKDSQSHGRISLKKKL